MPASSHRCLARIDARNIVAELISGDHPRPTRAIFEEPLYTIALQETQRHRLSLGRYCSPTRREDFRDIGRVVVLPAFMPLEVEASGGPNQSVRCMFTREMIESVSDGYAPYDHDRLSTCLNVRHRGITRLLQQLGEELRCPGLASVALVEALGTALIIEFIRYLDDQPKRDPRHRGGLSRQQFRRITERIETEEVCPSLTELSALTGLSVRHLTRAFKETTGKTVHAHIEQVRYEKAQSLLADTDMLVKAIAHCLGFSGTGAFSAAFQRLGGESPQAYRRRVRARAHRP